MATATDPNDWDEIRIRFLKTGFIKTTKQVKLRWKNTLNPSLKKSKWTRSEQKRLFKFYHICGNQWKAIATHFPGRTDNGIKNQFFSIIRKALRAAQRLSDQNGKTSFTKEINKIRPKLLADLINGNSGIEIEEGSVNFVQRFAFDEIESLEENKRERVKRVLDQLSKLNAFYIGKKTKPKKISKLARKDRTDNELKLDIKRVEIDLKKWSSSYLETPNNQSDIEFLKPSLEDRNSFNKQTFNAQRETFPSIIEVENNPSPVKYERENSLQVENEVVDRNNFNEELLVLNKKDSKEFFTYKEEKNLLKAKLPDFKQKNNLILDSSFFLNDGDKICDVGSPYENYIDFINISDKCNKSRSNRFF